MKAQIKTYSYPDGTMQRIQAVSLDDWERLAFLRMAGNQKALDCFYNIFQQFLVPSHPWLFGNIVMFCLPEGITVPFSKNTKYGTVAGDMTAAAAGLRRGVTIHRGKPVFRNKETETLWRALESQNCIRIVSGKLPVTTIIPVGNAPAFLSETCQEAAMKVNASFFIMDPFDCATVFDHVGTCLGLMVKDGVIVNPPLFDREALLVKTDGSVSIEHWDIQDLPVQIGDTVYRHGQNCRIFTRPRYPFITGRGTKLVVVGGRVEAVSQGTVPVPASGFVLCPAGECRVRPGSMAVYPAMEDVVFGIQVGNSILRDGVKTEKFRSKFYNIRRMEPVPFPPSLYPLDFHHARAARIALGADASGKPVVLWAEGAPKLGYVPGKHSRGASLSDMAVFCTDAGMVHAVNLDGGGSAQLLVHNQRMLEISDRNPDGTQSERMIPNGLMVK